MKRVFKTRHFGCWMRKTELTDDALCAAVHEMAQGLIDADLGGGVVKKRIRALQVGANGAAQEHWWPPTRVVDGFSSMGSRKNDRANIADDELAALQDIASQLLARSGQQLGNAVQDDSLQEICNDNKI